MGLHPDTGHRVMGHEDSLQCQEWSDQSVTKEVAACRCNGPSSHLDRGGQQADGSSFYSRKQVPRYKAPVHLRVPGPCLAYQFPRVPKLKLQAGSCPDRGEFKQERTGRPVEPRVLPLTNASLPSLFLHFHKYLMKICPKTDTDLSTGPLDNRRSWICLHGVCLRS